MPKLDDIATTLAAVPLFAQLSTKERRVVAKALGVHEVADDVMLVRQGESGDTFYVLLEGQAKVVRNGRKIATLDQGTWFGELALLDPGRRDATVTARTAMELIVLSQWDFEQALEEAPGMTRQLLAGMARRLRTLDQDG